MHNSETGIKKNQKRLLSEFGTRKDKEKATAGFGVGQLGFGTQAGVSRSGGYSSYVV